MPSAPMINFFGALSNDAIYSSRKNLPISLQRNLLSSADRVFILPYFEVYFMFSHGMKSYF